MVQMFRVIMEAGYTLLFLSILALILGYQYMDPGTLLVLLIGLALSIAMIVFSIVMIKKYGR